MEERPERRGAHRVVHVDVVYCEPGELVRGTDVSAPGVKEPASDRTISKGLRPKRVQLKRPASGA